MSNEQQQRVRGWAGEEVTPVLSAELGQRHGAVLAVLVAESVNEVALAAEAVAKELERELITVDLSDVLGGSARESEKKLALIFDVAGKSDAVLLFNAAGALFGKRTEVEDGHDRYDQMDTNYLLKLAEQYRGVMILGVSKDHVLDRPVLERASCILRIPDS